MFEKYIFVENVDHFAYSKEKSFWFENIFRKSLLSRQAKFILPLSHLKLIIMYILQIIVWKENALKIIYVIFAFTTADLRALATTYSLFASATKCESDDYEALIVIK